METFEEDEEMEEEDPELEEMRLRQLLAAFHSAFIRLATTISGVVIESSGSSKYLRVVITGLRSSEMRKNQ